MIHVFAMAMRFGLTDRPGKMVWAYPTFGSVLDHVEKSPLSVKVKVAAREVRLFEP